MFFLLLRQLFRHFLPNGVILLIGKSWGRYFNLIIKTNKKLCNSDLYDVLNIPRLFQQVEFRSLNSLNFLYCPSVGFEMTKIFPVRPLATSKFPTLGWYKASLIPDDAGNCQKLRHQFFNFYSRASLETIISFWFSVSRIKIHRTVKLLKWRQTTRLFIYLLYTKTLFQSTLFLARTVNAVIESKDDCQPSMRKGTCDGSFQIR